MVGCVLLTWNRMPLLPGSGRRTPQGLRIKSDSFLVVRQKEKVTLEVHGSGSKRGYKKKIKFKDKYPAFFTKKF